MLFDTRRIYGKIKKSTYKLKAHDGENQCQIGDTVKVMETRPLSKDKRWRVVEITEKAIIKQFKDITKKKEEFYYGTATNYTKSS